MIISRIAGVYSVRTDNAVFFCRARGIFRKKGISPIVGDRVVFTPLPGEEGIIEDIQERKNEFIRPCIANVDVLCYVFASRFPDPDPYLIDKMIVLSALKKVDIILVLNKTDLDEDRSAETLLQAYEKLGFQVIRVCAATGAGISTLRSALQGKCAVLCGNTGVGKSSIVNALDIGVDVKVSEISQKLGRGRHTTREVTLFPYGDNSCLADTPGFGNVDLMLEKTLSTDILASLFREFRPWLSSCRFADCTHTGETGCMVLEKMTAGHIPSSRYQSYARLYRELSERDNNKYN